MRNSLRNNQWAWRKRIEQKESQEDKKVIQHPAHEKEVPKKVIYQVEMVD